MSIIYVLIPIAVLFVLIGLGVFFWAVRSRQFDDLDKEAYSILFDNQQTTSKSATALPTADDPAAVPQSEPVSSVTSAKDQ